MTILINKKTWFMSVLVSHVTGYHQLDLKQHKPILSRFRRPEV